MNDKDRILMMIITRVIPNMIFKKEECVKLPDYFENNLSNGDLVFASSSIYPNDFMVGFVDSIKADHVVIREIGSKKCCRYFNESFYIIDKNKIGYEILEGIEYKTYTKVLKAFNEYASYTTKFKSLEFKNKLCIVEARCMFSNDTLFSISIPFNSKTSIKEIGLALVRAEKSNNKELKNQP